MTADRPLRLLVLTHNFPRYRGDHAGVFIWLLCRRLCEHGITPVVLAPHDPGAPERETMDGVLVRRFRYAELDRDETLAYRGNMHNLVLGSVSGPFRFKQFLDHFRRAAFELILEERIDLVSGHWLIPAGIVMKTIASRLPLPMILSSHGTDVRLMNRYLGLARRYFRSFFPRISTWTVVSEFLRQQILSREPSLEAVLRVLPLPHDETIFYADPNISRETDLIVSVTRYTSQKRVDQLVTAFGVARRQFPHARLELYGAGPDQPMIERQVRSLGLESAISMRAPIPQEQLRQVYNRASLVVLNSVEEGFGLALSEAMLCGAPVVGTNSGGIPDIITDRVTGRLVPPDNAELLANLLCELLTDLPQRRVLADQGHTQARNRYASAALAGQYAEIVRKAAEGKRY